MAHTQVQLARGTTAQIAAYTGPIGELVINTDDDSLVIQDGSTAGGKARIKSAPASATPISVPLTGNTITTAQGERNRAINPAGTLATLTITLPPSPQDTDTWTGMTSQALSALTVNAPGGATVNGGNLSPGANTSFSWFYVASSTTWYRR